LTLRVVFIGTPEFAVPTLREVHGQFDLVGVVTQPDRPQGRGRKSMPTPVKVAAAEMGVAVEEPEKIGSSQAVCILREWAPDVIVVAAYGQLLPREVLSLPRLGCINLHASLLPKFRGASPITAAILAGDEVTGVCTIMMNEGMDTGDLLLTAEIRVALGETTGSLHDRMLEPGAKLVVETLKAVSAGNITPSQQDHARATYTRPLSKEEGKIDWSSPAEFLDRLVRAMNPWPTAFCVLNGEHVKVWQAAVKPLEGPIGTIMSVTSEGILVGTGQGHLLLEEVQAPGKKRVSAADFGRGRRLKSGDRFE
jgi:methionyl-tRNA formyltransferase